jgi:hypothetical protein
MNKVYNWLSINSKIKKIKGVKTYNWGIPAYKSVTGLKTCPNAAAGPSNKIGIVYHGARSYENTNWKKVL